MSDPASGPLSDVLNWAHGVWLACLGLLTFFLKKTIEKVDEHEKALYAPEGALRRGDHNLRNDLEEVVQSFDRKLKEQTTELKEELTDKVKEVVGKAEKTQELIVSLREDMARAGYLRRRTRERDT